MRKHDCEAPNVAVLVLSLLRHNFGELGEEVLIKFDAASCVEPELMST